MTTSQNLPRNVYRKGSGYRGARMVAGVNITTRTMATPELAAAALAAAIEGDDTPADVSDLLGQVIVSADETGRLARKALLGQASEHRAR